MPVLGAYICLFVFIRAGMIASTYGRAVYLPAAARCSASLLCILAITTVVVVVIAYCQSVVHYNVVWQLRFLPLNSWLDRRPGGLGVNGGVCLEEQYGQTSIYIYIGVLQEN